MKYPVKVKHRGQVFAKIYKPTKAYPMYRLCWRVNGQRRIKAFPTYSAAKRTGDTLAGDLAKGSQVTALTPGQARDALAAFERLEAYRQSTGRRVSLLRAVSEYAESAGKLDCSVPEAVDGYLSTVAKVKRKDLKEAIDLFIDERKLRTVPDKEGKRPRLSPEHFYNTSLWLREFAKTFPGNAVCDLGKQHLALYMNKHAKAAAKTRNERRGIIGMFLRWSAEQDYLSRTHRLFEAEAMKSEDAAPDEIELYTADELRKLLERASKAPEAPEKGAEPGLGYRHLLPVLALAGLAGMRFKEIIRLDWGDVFHKSGHIEVKAHKSKTRSRRLIQVCPALDAWLEPYRNYTGLVWAKSYDMLHIDFAALRDELKIENRRNGLRHAFVSAHFAVYSDEGLTAAQAGNSPDVIHSHYKGLMTKKEGEAWFAVLPARAANVIALAAAAGVQMER